MPYDPYGVAPGGLLYAAAFWFTEAVKDAGIGGIGGGAEEAMVVAVLDGKEAEDGSVAMT